MELVGKQDPYCKFELGKYIKQGKTVLKGGKNPYFGEEEYLFWITEDNWVTPLKLSCYDEDIGSDDLIGTTHFSVLEFMQETGRSEHVLSLLNNKKAAGDVHLKLEFFPSGKLQFNCISGRDLRDVDSVGQQDPYLKFILEGGCTKSTKRTKVHNDGGTTPNWSEKINFDVVDQFNITIECWDADTVGDDDLIGKF